MLRKTLLPSAVVAAWLIAFVTGSRWLLDYQAAPAGAAEAPADWPPGGALRPSPGRFTLLMFAHPHCPCTPAGLDELSWLLARAEGKAEATVVFVVPPGAPDGWADTPLWREAASIPDVRTVADAGGREARRFGAGTSGQVLLYDPRGRLVFRGGITDGRGHRGDNPGRRAVLGWLTCRDGGLRETLVYGCPLLDGDAPCTKEGSRCRQ